MERVAPVLAIDDHGEAVAFGVAGYGFEVLLEPRHEAVFPVFAAVKQRDPIRSHSEHLRGPEHPGRGPRPDATDSPAEGVPR